MIKRELEEAEAIITAICDALLTTIPTKGRAGSNLRIACGKLKAKAKFMFQDGTVATPLRECFDLAYAAGAVLDEMAYVRAAIFQQSPIYLPGILTMNAGLLLCLSTEGRVIARMAFTSRQDVEALNLRMNDVFSAAIDAVADSMEASTFQALIGLHAAVTAHLVETARPLPRMLKFRFAEPNSTLVFAYKLYDDAGRCDQLREENKVVHPAFMLQHGRALSA
jgi:hypothetical protein